MNAFFSSWEFANAMSSPWHTVGWTMCLFLVLGTLVALIGAVVRLLCNRAASTVRYTVSLAVFATLAMLPLGIGVWLSQSPPTAIAIDIENQPAPPISIELKPQIAPPSGREPVATNNFATNSDSSHPEGGAIYGFSFPDVIAYLPWLWIAGAPITFALLATGLIGSERLRRGGTPITDGIVAETYSQLRESLNITRQVSLALCDRIARPVLVGILRPLILLPPAALTGWSPDELEMVLLHELAHVRRWDNLVNLLQRVVESLLFFHPAIWLVSRQVRRDREQCCDAVVVAHTAKPQAYAALLVSIAAKESNSLSLATASAMADHPLAARIRRILKLEDEPMLVSRRTLGFFALFAASIVAIVLWQPAKITIAEEPKPEVVKKEIASQESTSKETTTQSTEKVEIELTRKFFLESDQNPMEIVSYTVQEQTPIQLEVFFEGLEKDPYGPQIAFEREWKDGRKQLSITAPALAHEYFFKPFFAKFREETENSPTAKLAKDKKAKIVFSPVVRDTDRIPLLEWEKLTNTKGGATVRWNEDGTKISIEGTDEQRKQFAKLLARMRKNPDNTESSPTTSEPLRIAPGDQLLVRVEGEFANNPIDDGYQVQPNGTLALGPTYGRVEVAGKTIQEAELLVTDHLKTILSDVAVQLTWAMPKEKDSTLLYDGKTFDEWRQMWRTELKTERRTECINALAAFARAGHAKEAAETILDVAGEYDFTSIDDNAAGKLKQAVIEVLSIPVSHQISPAHWLPSLMKRYKTEPDKLRWLTIRLVSNVQPNKPELARMLLEIYKNQQDPPIRLAAFNAICRVGYSTNTWELLAEGLRDSDPNLVASACSLIGNLRPQDSSNPEFEKLKESWLEAYVTVLVHRDRGVRRVSRRSFSWQLTDEDAKTMMSRLLSIVQSETSSEKRIRAIRALAAMKDKARDAKPEIIELLKTTTDEKTMIATAFAITRLNLSRNENGIGQLNHLCLPILQETGRWPQYVNDDRARKRFWDVVSMESQEVLGAFSGGGGGEGF